VIDGTLLHADKDHDERRIRTLDERSRGDSVILGGGAVRKYSDWLTAANNNNESMTSNPGSGKTRKAEMRYMIYIDLLLISVNAFLLP
jgi:hypothetical protein